MLSRRAILERERAEAQEQLIAGLEVGAVREGIVTRLQPFGAFVDIELSECLEGCSSGS